MMFGLNKNELAPGQTRVFLKEKKAGKTTFPIIQAQQ